MPDIHTWLPSATISSNSAARRSGVEMGRNLIQQQDRCRAVAAPPNEIGVRQHEADQQGLLLAGGAYLGRHFLRAMPDDQIGAMRPLQSTTGGTVALAPGGE